MEKDELYDLAMAQFEVDLESAGYKSKDVAEMLSGYTEKDKEAVLNTLYPFAEEVLQVNK